MSHFRTTLVVERTREYTVALGDSDIFGKKVLAVQWHIDGQGFPLTNNKMDWCPVPESVAQSYLVDGAFRHMIQSGK